MAAQTRPEHDETIVTRLEHEIASLETRLRAGEEKIEQARGAGQLAEVRRFEAHWIALLARYEQLCDEIASLRAASANPVAD